MILLTALCVIVLNTSCKKFVVADSPRSELVTKTVYESDATAIAAISGIYRLLIEPSGFASGSSNGVSFLAGLSADELVNFGVAESSFYNNNLLPINGTVKDALWAAGFKYIYYCNSALEGLENSSSISDSIKNQLTGEVLFLRSFSYFYLTNMFGDIPLITSTNYEINMRIGKSSQSEIYKLIKQDLSDAKQFLLDDYSMFQSQRVRATRWAATALLARVYLFEGDYQNAELESSTVIAKTSLFSLENDLNKVFLKNSSEAIWQLMPVEPGNNTWEGPLFIPVSGLPETYLSDDLLTSINNNDKRKSEWIGSYDFQSVTYRFPNKYKLRYNEPLNEYSMVLRLSEMYLIRAEARTQEGNIPEAINDLDLIKSRAQIPLISIINPSIDQLTLLSEIEKERRIELFSEWGHRWFDLKRTKMADSVLSGIKGSSWQAFDTLYPIPQSEINNNSNLLPQNSGYN